jgi:hypothetical protein
MKAGDLFMIQYCAEHQSFRVLPLHTCMDLARLDMEKGIAHGWVVVGHAGTESDALARMKNMKKNICDRVEDAQKATEGSQLNFKANNDLNEPRGNQA